MHRKYARHPCMGMVCALDVMYLLCVAVVEPGQVYR